MIRVEAVMYVYRKTYCILEVCDKERPYLQGGVGVSMQHGTHDKCRRIKIGRA